MIACLILLGCALLGADCPGCVPCTSDLTPLMDDGDGLINWARVDETLYRGGQPFVRSKVNGYRTLQAMGVRTVINVRTLGGTEEQAILSLNMHTRDKERKIYYIHISMSPTRTDLDYLSGRLSRILKAIETSPPPVFIHCHNGKDRTGIIVAAYRIRVQGWSLERAVQEMKLCHYHEGRGSRHFVNFLRWWVRYDNQKPRREESQEGGTPDR